MSVYLFLSAILCQVCTLFVFSFKSIMSFFPQGNATLHLYPHFKELAKLEGNLLYFNTKI